LTVALGQFADVVERVDSDRASGTQSRLSTEEFTELADFAIELARQLAGIADALRNDQLQKLSRKLELSAALWAAEQGAYLNSLEAVTDTLAALANGTHAADDLRVLGDAMETVIGAAAPVVKHDLDKANPGRPWRVLNLNACIVATRCHDPERMRAAFDRLVDTLPEEAPAFFREGMRQMDALDYPPHVREVVAEYHRRFSDRQLH
jgi:HPt (histidine-containing phosphotransfer) domain-containing protein